MQIKTSSLAALRMFLNSVVLATSDIRSQNCQLDLLFFFVM
jgi:hypothetical protein